MTSRIDGLNSVGIIGGGVVGRATARSLLEWVDVKVYDVLPDRRTTQDLDEVMSCDLVFVCLPTPKDKVKFRCDTSILDSFFNSLDPKYLDAPVVLRSTVPIGYTRGLNELHKGLIHNPEFLTARCSLTDAHLPSRHVIGYNPDMEAHGHQHIHQTVQKLTKLYHARFPGVQIHSLSSDESEAVKLFQNSFFAVKVAFWNECFAVAQSLKLNWKGIMKAVLADGRIAHSHTQVPGPDGKCGFGGECLPKDLANLIYTMTEAGLKSSVMLGAFIRNLEDRKVVVQEDKSRG